MLSRAQATELGYASQIERLKDTSNGPGCRWRDSETNEVAIVMLNDQPLGLTGAYQNKDIFGYFEPLNIAGYPAVLGGAIDNRDNGACAMSVGVTDKQVITLTASMLPGTAAAKRPCAVLKRAGEMAVETMSAGA